jgi:ribonuclease HI
MSPPTPHYLLFSQANGANGPGCWRFLLRNADGSGQFEAADMEAGVHGARLELLTVVRALESLDQPSRVTLIGCSRYIRHGMQYGLSEWRDNGWRWESFGQLVPIKNGDLWQRMDRAMRFHRVECCHRRLDPPHRWPLGPHTEAAEKGGALHTCMRVRVPGQLRLRYRAPLLLSLRRCLIAALLGRLRQRAVRSWTALKPSPRSG